MVERGARALHKVYHANTMDGRSGGSADDAWDRLAKYDAQDEWREASRAHFAAIREPTEAMVAAPDPWDGDQTYASVWRDMIDAALK
jgi:hypothetical protein